MRTVRRAPGLGWLVRALFDAARCGDDVIGQRPSLRHRIQGGIARVLKRLGFDQLGWDVATFSPTAGHFCARCAKRSHTEREHLTHACRFERRHTVHDALGITPEHAAFARREWGDGE